MGIVSSKGRRGTAKAVKGLGTSRFPQCAARAETEDASAPGLRVRMKAIKESVKSQYGSSSAEYAQVRGIKV